MQSGGGRIELLNLQKQINKVLGRDCLGSSLMK